MPYVITEACVGVKDKSCVDVCPVDCIYEGEGQLFIHPDECIDCGACEPECPVTAIFPEEDVPGNLTQFVQINRDAFKSATPPKRPTR
jgi:NAD-dependent dihydropyrimidine dehydrogenase PreA subunit